MKSCILFLMMCLVLSTAVGQTNFTHTGNCTNSPIQYSFPPDPTVDQITWNFDDFFDPANNISHLASPIHYYGTAGNFNVSLTRHYTDNHQDVVYILVAINAPSDIITSVNPATSCLGTTLSITASGLSTYKWTPQGQSNSLGNQPTLLIKSWEGMVLTVSGDDANGCFNSKDIAIDLYPPIPIKIAPYVDSICPGIFTRLSGQNANTYQWYDVTRQDSLISTHSEIDVAPTITTTYIVKTSDTYGCTYGDAQAVHVFNPGNIVASAQQDTVCAHTTDKLLVKGTQTQLWSKLSSPGVYLGTDTVLLAIVDSSTSFLVKGTDAQGCSVADTIRVGAYPSPPLRSFMGPSVVCPFSGPFSYTLSDSSLLQKASKSNFMWTVDHGSILGSNKNSALIQFPSSVDTWTIKVTETNQYGCSSDTLTFSVISDTKLHGGAPRGKSALCSNDTLQTYRLPFKSPGSVYAWQCSNCTLLQNDMDSITLSWNYSLNNRGKLWYDESSGSGGSSCQGSSDTLFVVINPTPVPAKITGNKSICISDPLQTYTAIKNPNYQYLWAISANPVFTGQGSNKININWPSTGQFIINLQAKDNFGCSALIDIDTVVIYSNPSKPSITGIRFICLSNKDSAVYKVLPFHANAKYTWTTEGGTVIRQAADSALVAWDELSALHNISLKETSVNNCESQPEVFSPQYRGIKPTISSILSEEPKHESNRIAWSAADLQNSPGQYSLYRRTSGTNSWSRILDTTYATFFSDVAVATHDSLYFYYVSAKDDCGKRSLSNPANSLLLKGILEEDNKILLNWNKAVTERHVSNYEIWLQKEDHPFEKLVNSTDTSFIFNERVTGRRVCFRVISKDDRTDDVSSSNDTCFSLHFFVNIPSAFSPDGDGVNDTWVLQNIESFPRSDLKVFNRYGEIVYLKEGYNNTWNGEVNGKPLPAGTYFYVLKLNSGLEGKNEFCGSVTIIRQ